MPLFSRRTLEVPAVSVPSFLFDSLQHNAGSGTSDPVFVDAKRPTRYAFTMQNYRDWSRRVASGLLAAGLQSGDRVVLCAGNNIFTPMVVMGTIMAGGIYSSANPGLTPRELAYQLRNCTPRFLLAAPNCLENARLAADAAGMDRDSIFEFDTLDSTASVERPLHFWSWLIAGVEQGDRFVWEPLSTGEAASRTAMLCYSSGTTGLPKGVELTHSNLVANMMQLGMVQFSNKSIADRRGLCVLPMYHALALIYYAFVGPKAGLQTIIMERYNLARMMEHVAHFKITDLLLVPPILISMAKHPRARDDTFDLSSIRKVVTAAAPLGKEVTEQAEEIWAGQVKVRQAWGMSEIPCMGLCWEEGEHRGPTSTSVGELLPGVEGMIVNEDNVEETEPGKRGELWLRGPNVMKGYWHNSSATADTVTQDGWLKTGDIALVDEAGKWYIVDRKKELIKVRGAQVAPAELEALLFEHPQVLDAAVIGVKTATDDEDPRAYIVARDRTKVSERDIVVFVQERVAKVKRLTGGVVFVDSIPKNPSGKILRRLLRDMAAKRSETPRAKL
ncbi:putative 4-coumarate-CoA ligase [Lophiostoma macrostomum CBS 122681]|uniref:Putative 4-coumarate-CoA ligase n=1 Tax=Lophiostoma macrostomum CBS 122681 TaxID=1314788 RepID=A0A6A6SLV9_9PLEO|nr:putative 4-coumarate-CoA ligase [Lophiostoma macrostomum CBS 122681]